MKTNNIVKLAKKRKPLKRAGVMWMWMIVLSLLATPAMAQIPRELLRKIEELTLYIIDQNKRIQELEKKTDRLNN